MLVIAIAAPRLARGAAMALLAASLAGCRSMPYTLDDGRRIEESKLEALRTFGKGRQALREALPRASPATRSGCETEWELPFAVASSDELPPAERVAWVRALNVDERATVVASAAGTGLAPGDKLVGIDGERIESGMRMAAALAERRDAGRPFEVATAAGRAVRTTPLRVCRGRAQVAAPATPDAQDYHWGYSVHPQEVFRADLSADEALWVVLWTQGLSAEGAPSMMGYQYGVAPLRLVLNVAALLSGAGAVAKAAQAAGPAAASEVGAVVAKNVATGVAVGIAKEKAGDAMSASSRNRAGLEGVAWVAGTQFDKADRWCFERMAELGADPLAGFSLHRKLVASGSVGNAFVLDGERLPALMALAEGRNL
ncbi:MAG TPA: hypothetical protein VF801_11620, partial [Rhodocyclaceae bacterium]